MTNKNNTKQNKGKTIGVIIGFITLFLVGLGLAFNQQIRDAVLQHNSDKTMQMLKKGQKPQDSKIAKENKKLDKLKQEYANALKNGDGNKANELAKKIKKDSPNFKSDWSSVKPMSTGEALSSAGKTKKEYGIGAMAVPAVGLYLPIVQGISNETLSQGGGTFWAEQSLEYSNNYPVAGHYLSTHGPLFSPLAQAQPGETLYATDFNRVYTYRIYSNTIIKPTNTGVLNMNLTHNGKRIFTALTCHDWGSNRTMIRAELIGSQKATNSSLKVFHNIWY